MSIKNLFVPEILEKTSSKYNSDIRVYQFLNEYRLEMGGLTQSAQIMADIWQEGIKFLLPKNIKPKSILMLGFGGGSTPKMLNKKFPKAKIISVEIDPVVIKFAKKYFNADKLKNHELINQDAVEYVKKLNSQNIFDLILVDTYIGFEIPKKFQDPKFLKKLKTHTNVLLLNRLNWDSHEIDTMLFLDLLKQSFDPVIHKTTSNMIISL